MLTVTSKHYFSIRHNMDDAQRSAMFSAWKSEEDKKQLNCEHHFGYAEPVHCFKCGILKSKYVKNFD